LIVGAVEHLTPRYAREAVDLRDANPSIFKDSY
jgi:hypothetical protein